MNKHLQNIINIIQEDENLSAEQKSAVLKSLKDADKELEITTFKLDRTEKVKRTTAILLEETIAELEQKRKAVEDQNHELEIESALERIRSRSLGMRKSDELRDVVKLVFEILQELSYGIDGAAFIMTISGDSESVNAWIGDNHAEYPTCFNIPRFNTPAIKDIWNTIESGVDFISKTYSSEEKNHWFRYAFENTELRTLPDELKNWILQQEYLTQSFSWASKSGLGIHFHHQRTLTDNEIDILKRFSNVFDQAYTRFLDLQKAEAQAREAQIEAAVERVRAEAMAMHSAEDFGKVAQRLLQQVQGLGIKGFTGATIYLVDESEFITGYDFSAFGGLKDAKHQIFRYDANKFPLTGIYILKEWKKGASYFEMDFDFEKLQAAAKEFEQIDLSIANSLKEALASGKLTHQWAACGRLKNGFIAFDMITPPNEDVRKITIKMSYAFNQAYTRFLDLQKAEAQAREAQIEAALEKVRSRTMAMQRSEELPEVAALLFQQVKTLGVPQFHCGFNIFEIDDKECIWYPGSADGDILPPCKIPLTEHPVFMNFIESRKRGDELCVYEKEGEYQAGHYRYMLSLPVLGEILQNMLDAGIPFPTFQIDHLANFSHGNLLFITSEHFPEMHDTFKRFAKVFEQTYTRFLDLQKAEAQALEATKRASVDRVRAEIASMRTTKDLERITPLIWKELTILGIPFIRCGVFIMDESLRQIHTFLSTPDGRAIAAFHLPYDIPGRTSEILASWLNKEVYIEHWDETAFSELGDLLVQQGSLTSKDVYLKTVPHGGLHLHCLPFLQGMLYVGNTIRLKSDEIALIQSVADAFSTAYARYEDFNKLEAAKQQVDKTLVDLKQAQQQLVQSEKMASLGELTAGIAHEIQNPLNFVNNFSEVNMELIKEIQDERRKTQDKRDEKLEDELLNDIAQNQEKVLHHGKRADGIVKGMLQHSRSSSGVKELTDINALADEYLRLAYHGLRAKDKSFNATMRTDFNESIGQVKVVPQDIGRVILNLITNAFYVVNEKLKADGEKSSYAKASEDKYEPTVSVITKKEGNKVLISVKDNGNGIPDSIKEKIFQPFFTTKPTGQGTGLGLSLSYDIVKAHGGYLHVETKESEGTIFTIELPI